MKTIRFQFSHGSYIKEKTVEKTLEGRGIRAIDVETDFGYLFLDLAQDEDNLLPAVNSPSVIANLKKLGEAMIDNPGPDSEAANSVIPPVYTYWGQFIDHDITANTDRAATEDLGADITQDDFQPLSPNFIIDKLKNLRRPTLDLDSVYGDGPPLDPSNPTDAADFYDEDDPVKLKVGQNAQEDENGNPVPGERIPPDDDLNRDLPRGSDQKATIGDSRNDENLIVAQFHTAFLRFHNAVVDWVRQNEPEYAQDPEKLFNRAQNLVRWHYQWLVINDFLKTITSNGTVEDILNNGLKFYQLKEGQELFMPLEFSVAAYRFGHSIIRGAYDFNRNFGEEAVLVPQADFELLFAFTGGGGLGQKVGQGPFATLPFNWIIEWDRFINKTVAAQRQMRSARKIDTHLAFPLSEMLNEGEEEAPPIQELLKHLAKRNLLRGYLLSIPTGQSLADAVGIEKLTTAELQQDNSEQMNEALAPFLEKTPAWYYILKESQVRAGGDSLGELGSRIVAETIIGLITNDPYSYLNQKGSDKTNWEPSQGVKLPNGGKISTIGDFLEFAGVLPPN